MREGTGIITSLLGQRKFGYIRREDGTQIFFHAKGVVNPDFEGLREGNRVKFFIVDSPKGDKAIGVELIL